MGYQASVSGGITRLVYVQPDTSGVWAGRPMALVVPVPAGATRLEAYLMSAGMSGGSGRRGAPGTARSGGQGGGPGGVNTFVIPLTAASTVTLTVGAPPPVAPGVTTNDTNGMVPTMVTGRATVLVCDGASYASVASDQPLVAASTASLGASPRGFGAWLTQAGGATSITAAAATLYAGVAGEVAGPGTGADRYPPGMWHCHMAPCIGTISPRLPSSSRVPAGRQGGGKYRACGLLQQAGSAVLSDSRAGTVVRDAAAAAAARARTERDPGLAVWEDSAPQF